LRDVENMDYFRDVENVDYFRDVKNVDYFRDVENVDYFRDVENVDWVFVTLELVTRTETMVSLVRFVVNCGKYMFLKLNLSLYI